MKKVVITLLSISAVFFFISCGSKPAPEEEVPVEAPVVETAEPEVEETSVEEDLNEGLSEEEYAALLEIIEDARNTAIEAGAEEQAPEYLNQIDELFESLKGDGLEDYVDSLVARYKLLADYLNAQNAKKEIDDNGFAFYSQKDYDEGSAYLDEVASVIENSDEIDPSMSSTAEKAYVSFNKVLNIAYKRIAKEERELAYAAKKNADTVKAAVSQKERYKAAAEDFQNGDSLYSMQNAKKAYEKYLSAEESFNALYEEVSEKRAAAQAAIEAAKRRVEESAKYAEEADAEAPITDNELEGIEDEDTVLLEQDEYEDPSEAEVEFAETIDDEYDTESVEAEEDAETMVEEE